MSTQALPELTLATFATVGQNPRAAIGAPCWAICVPTTELTRTTGSRGRMRDGYPYTGTHGYPRESNAFDHLGAVRILSQVLLVSRSRSE